jgi:4-aminobutyrate aminotransferase-like enzyme
VHGRGLVAGLHIVKSGPERAQRAEGRVPSEPDGDRAHAIVRRCVEKGLLLFAPVGYGGATVKIAPPLTITADAIREGAEALAEAVEES